LKRNETTRDVKYLSVILFLAISEEVFSQNAIYLCLQPNDIGYGVRYDYSFKKIGLYSSVTHGTYHLNTLHLANHTKLSLGTTFSYKAGKGNFLSVGLNYNQYKKLVTPDPSKLTYTPLGVEIGAGTSINRFIFAFRYELIKSNVSLDFGIKF
jgi:hypothetical protein